MDVKTTVQATLLITGLVIMYAFIFVMEAAKRGL